jgi:acetylornithine deacetylase/succinyl-diaminopimelate desuccinylase-like protein
MLGNILKFVSITFITIIIYYFYFINQLSNKPTPKEDIKIEFKKIMETFKEKKQDVIKRLSKGIQFETIHYTKNEKEFLEFGNFLKKDYPLFHKHLSLEIVGPWNTLLYKWDGESKDLDPILIVSHYDVVPASNQEKWKHPPFSGKIEDGFVYGRGKD